MSCGHRLREEAHQMLDPTPLILRGRQKAQTSERLPLDISLGRGFMSCWEEHTGGDYVSHLVLEHLAVLPEEQVEVVLTEMTVLKIQI